MAQDVYFKLVKIILLDEKAEETNREEFGFISFGDENDEFAHLTPDEAKNMTAEKAYDLMGYDLQSEADSNGGFIYCGDFIPLPFEEEE